MTQRIAVIGATGQIGSAVVRELVRREVEVVAVGRSPFGGDRTAGASSRTVSSYARDELAGALEGTDHAIVTLGLPYRADVWEAEWPRLTTEVAGAAAQAGTPLTFLDNLYAYGAATSPIGEDAPLTPCSRKGTARLKGFRVLQAARGNGLDVVVCRAADFAGPGAETTILPWSGVVAAATGRSRSLRWFGDPDAPHSFVTPDAVAAGLVTAATDPGLRRQDVLHLPAMRPFTGRELAERLGGGAGRKVRLTTLGTAALSLAGLVSGPAREQREMMYQVEGPYVLDDSRYRAVTGEAQDEGVDDLVALARSCSSADGDRAQ